jgi:hypothetical protein
MLHPTIYNTKKMIRGFHKERELVMFCDLHGHSRRKNVFMYGCSTPHAPEETRIFPYLLSKLCPYFSFEYSKFGVQKSKEATARVALFKELKNVSNIFTMESSFCGNDLGKFAGYHFTSESLEQIGRDFCRTLLAYSDIHIPEELQNITFDDFPDLKSEESEEEEDNDPTPMNEDPNDKKPAKTGEIPALPNVKDGLEQQNPEFIKSSAINNISVEKKKKLTIPMISS